MSDQNLPAIIGPGNSYIPLLAVQQRSHSRVYPMTVRQHGSAAEATAASLQARHRLRTAKLMALLPEPPRSTVRVIRVEQPSPEPQIQVGPVDPVGLNMLGFCSASFLIRLVALRTDIAYHEITGHCRTKPIVAARYMAMGLVYQHTQLSMPCVGRLFHRDHTTVLHGLGKIGANKKLVEYAAASLAACRPKADNPEGLSQSGASNAPA